MGARQLCQHNPEHNQLPKVLSAMPVQQENMQSTLIQQCSCNYENYSKQLMCSNRTVIVQFDSIQYTIAEQSFSIQSAISSELFMQHVHNTLIHWAHSYT